MSFAETVQVSDTTIMNRITIVGSKKNIFKNILTLFGVGAKQQNTNGHF